MKRLAFLIIIWTAAPAFAQGPIATQNSKLGWDEPAPTLADANRYRYDVTIDTAAPVQLTPVICTGPAGPAGFPCLAPFPAATPTALHSMSVTAIDPATAIASLPSISFPFRFGFAPSMPANLRVIP